MTIFSLLKNTKNNMSLHTEDLQPFIIHVLQRTVRCQAWLPYLNCMTFLVMISFLKMVWIIHYLPHLLQNAYLSAGNQVKKNMTSPEIYVLRLVQMNMDQCHLTYMRKQTVLICLLQVLLVPEYPKLLSPI